MCGLTHFDLLFIFKGSIRAQCRVVCWCDVTLPSPNTTLHSSPLWLLVQQCSAVRRSVVHGGRLLDSLSLSPCAVIVTRPITATLAVFTAQSSMPTIVSDPHPTPHTHTSVLCFLESSHHHHHRGALL